MGGTDVVLSKSRNTHNSITLKYRNCLYPFLDISIYPDVTEVHVIVSILRDIMAILDKFIHNESFRGL